MFRRTLLTTGTAVLIAFGGGSAMAQDMNIVELAQSNEDLGTLVVALQAADLVQPLAETGPYTVFAPSNAAFDALPDGTLESLLMEENKEQLVSILTYHVSARGHRTAAANLTDGMQGDTLNGARVQVANDGTIVKVNDATVVQADLQASNGIVHVIDTVLIPE